MRSTGWGSVVVGVRAALLVALLVLAGKSSATRRGEDASRPEHTAGPRVVFDVAGTSPPGGTRVVLRRHVQGEPAPGAATEHFVGAEGDVLDLAPGPPCRLEMSSETAVVWPRCPQARNGDVLRVQVEPLVEVRIVASGAAAGPALGRLAFAVDRFAPPSGPRERIEALQVAVDLAAPVAERRGGAQVVRLPRGTRWWCLGELGRTPFLVLFAADEGTVVLDAPRLRTLADEPRVVGSPIPPGTLVAPGRLDLWAVACVRDAVVRRGWKGAVIRGREAWAGAGLPAADVLTLAHPSFGFAYPAWTEDPVDGRPEPCEIRFEARRGGRFSASVAVWPAWPGAEGSFSRPFDAGLRYLTTSAASLTFRGLPPGDYRFDYRAAPARAPLGRELRQGSRRLSASSPREVIVVATGPE
jgi:hypothetical protein